VTSWHPGDLPDQSGRVFAVTGGNAGLGYFTAEQLARAGARVLLASRSEQRAAVAMSSMRRQVPDADLGFVPLDLASLTSVREASAHLGALDRLDGLVLNAGRTTGSRTREVTEDGNERTLQVNYLGHFALAAGALPSLQRTPGSRVVGLGSLATRIVPLDAEDLQSVHRFGFFRAYAFSKHAISGFVLELDRRLRAAGSPTAAVLAHPGYALDVLSATRPGVITSEHPLAERASALGAQGKNRGAACTVRALLDPTLQGGEFVGPRWAVAGRPVPARPARSSAAPEFGRKLWDLSERWADTEFAVR
jgi:NAD(P)-dependent dehydrogenase (short-subunit alcohol dehydrogenase family)